MGDAERVTLAEAATMTGKSKATIRRWVRDGALTRYEGDAPSGGSAPVLVDRAELLALLAAGDVAPSRPREPDAPPAPPTTAPAVDAVELVRLRGELEAATLRGELEATRLRGEVATLEARLRGAEQAAFEATARADDWRERFDAVSAELRAERARSGGSWWRRLLPGGSE